ncbi:MAG: PorT family protein [Flavobacteriaceae bacterium]|nr:PorT family protein [Flavobacteriaceae bacterium]
MNKIFLIIFLIYSSIYSQIEYGLKGGISFNSKLNISANIESIDNAINIFESRNGIHFGGFAKLSIGNFFIRPEIIYSKIDNSYNIPDILVKTKNVITDFSQNKIDMPILIGYKFYRIVNAFAGPRFEYIGKVKYDNLNVDDLKDKIETGLQYGIGIKFGKIEVDLRVERGFSKNEIKFMENQIGEKNQYISSQGKLYLLGISYYF